MYLAGKPRRIGKYRLEAQGDIRFAGLCHQDVEGYRVKQKTGVMQGCKKVNLLKNRLGKKMCPISYSSCKKVKISDLKVFSDWEHYN